MKNKTIGRLYLRLPQDKYEELKAKHGDTKYCSENILRKLFGLRFKCDPATEGYYYDKMTEKEYFLYMISHSEYLRNETETRDRGIINGLKNNPYINNNNG